MPRGRSSGLMPLLSSTYLAGMGVSEYEPEGPGAEELNALWRWVNARLKGLES